MDSVELKCLAISNKENIELYVMYKGNYILTTGEAMRFIIVTPKIRMIHIKTHSLFNLRSLYLFNCVDNLHHFLWRKP